MAERPAVDAWPQAGLSPALFLGTSITALSTKSLASKRAGASSESRPPHDRGYDRRPKKLTRIRLDPNSSLTAALRKEGKRKSSSPVTQTGVSDRSKAKSVSRLLPWVYSHRRWSAARHRPSCSSSHRRDRQLVLTSVRRCFLSHGRSKEILLRPSFHSLS